MIFGRDLTGLGPVTAQHLPLHASSSATLKRKFAKIRSVLGANLHSKETKMYFVNQKMLSGNRP